MVSPIRKREAVRYLTKSLEVPERRACRIIGQPRSTQRYRAKVKDDEGQIVRRMHELVRLHPRFGYRRIGQLLRREGWRINKKRVYRLWKQEGFKVPQKKRKKRRLGCTANGIQRRRAQSIDEVWCWGASRGQLLTLDTFPNCHSHSLSVLLTGTTMCGQKQGNL